MNIIIYNMYVDCAVLFRFWSDVSFFFVLQNNIIILYTYLRYYVIVVSWYTSINAELIVLEMFLKKIFLINP